jgi:hypothetical protein
LVTDVQKEVMARLAKATKPIRKKKKSGRKR